MSIPIRFPIGLLIAFSLCACGRSEPPATSFSGEVMPILQSRCGECHAPGQPGYEASGLSFADYDSIMAGTGAAFSLFPPENASGNYVKVVQRVPVKIVFDDIKEAEPYLRVGMSVVPTILTKE